MTKQQEAIKKEMVEQFMHWVKYNPTVVKEKFDCEVGTVQYILNNYMFID